MSNDIHATLTIGQQEAQNGTVRTLTLTGGHPVTVTIPAGAYDGQVLQIHSQGTGQPGTLFLRLQIQQEAGPATATDASVTFQSFPPVPNSGPFPTTAHNPHTTSQPPATPLPATHYSPPSIVPPPPPPSENWSSMYGGGQGYQPSPSPYSSGTPFHGTSTGHPSGFHQAQTEHQGPSANPYVPTPSPKSKTPYRLAIIISLVIIVLGGSVITFLAVRDNQIKTDNRNGTSTALADRENGTASVQTATANSETATATVQRTATQTARQTATTVAQATRTAQAQATADVLNGNPNPYLPGQGTLKYIDKMDGNSSLWTTNDNCTYKDGSLRVLDNDPERTRICWFNGDDIKNFTVEFKMTILQGDTGGISFRSNSSPFYSYTLIIGTEGYHQLLRYDNNQAPVALVQNQTPEFRQGVNQENTIGLVVQDDAFTWYVNGKPAGSFKDSKYGDAGTFSFMASSYNTNGAAMTEVAFKDFRLWEL